MYEIRPESVKTFISDRTIRLPRFQRKQTWDEKKNFQLCISLFKEYPIGVCILSSDSQNGKEVKWLLDGRQRKNALTLMREDPENIYNWSKKFIKFGNKDQPSEVEEKFWREINKYIELDEEEVSIKEEQENDTEYDNHDMFDREINSLDTLLEIVKIMHNKNSRGNGFTRCFDFSKMVDRIPYEIKENGKIKLSTKKLKTFLDEYRNYCDEEDYNYNDQVSFIDFLEYRCVIEDEEALKSFVKKNWEKMNERIEIIEKIDCLLGNSKIGIIEVKNLTPADSQKIFNIINSGGEKLTAVEILSAKPQWNKKIKDPSKEAVKFVEDLYKRIGSSHNDVVRWDLAATFARRLGKNIVLREFNDSKTDFEKEITIGFKLLSGILVDGVKKEDIEKLSKNNKIDWDRKIESLIYDLNSIMKQIETNSYFKFLKSWETSIMELTSDAIAMNFIIILYKDWCKKGKPTGGDLKSRQFSKNAFILLDKLIYEYINRVWRGSSDSRIANNIIELNTEKEVFKPIEKENWIDLLEGIYEDNKIDGNEVTAKLMKPLLYHSYSIAKLSAFGSNYGYEIDHILPQDAFKDSTISEGLKDSLYNLALLPKDENILKGKKRLNQIHDEWLINQIEKYEFIEEVDFDKFSDLTKYDELYNNRKKKFIEIFKNHRESLLNN